MKITDNPKFNKLKAKMFERGLNMPALAKLMNVHVSNLYRKLNDFKKLTIGEVLRLKDILGLTDEEAVELFLL